MGSEYENNTTLWSYPTLQSLGYGTTNIDIYQIRHRTRGRKGWCLPFPFSKMGKSSLIWKKIPWLWSSMGKMKFLRIYREKNRYFFSLELFFLLFQVNVYPSAQVQRKLPCHKKFLVTCLKIWHRVDNSQYVSKQVAEIKFLMMSLVFTQNKLSSLSFPPRFMNVDNVEFLLEKKICKIG